MRVLAIYSEKRSPLYPDVPTLRELGYQVGNHDTKYVVAGPKGLPKDVVQTLYQDGSTAGYVPWNLRTKDNLDLAPGLYVFHVDAGGLGSSIGKFAVIK